MKTVPISAQCLLQAPAPLVALNVDPFFRCRKTRVIASEQSVTAATNGRRMSTHTRLRWATEKASHAPPWVSSGRRHFGYVRHASIHKKQEQKRMNELVNKNEEKEGGVASLRIRRWKRSS